MKQFLSRMLFSPIYLLLIIPSLVLDDLVKIGIAITVIVCSVLFAIFNIKFSRFAIALLSLFIMVYLASMVSLLILSTTEVYFIQPFMLTVAVYFGFLTLTYSVDEYLLVNRWGYSLILIIVYSVIKVMMLSLTTGMQTNQMYIVSEGVSLFFTLMLAGTFTFAVTRRKSIKVTNLIKIEEVNVVENIKVIKVNKDVNLIQMNTDDTLTSIIARKQGEIQNALSWVQIEAIKAYNDKKSLMIVANCNQSKVVNVNVPGSHNSVNVYLVKELNDLEERIKTYQTFIKES